MSYQFYIAKNLKTVVLEDLVRGVKFTNMLRKFQVKYEVYRRELR